MFRSHNHSHQYPNSHNEYKTMTVYEERDVEGYNSSYPNNHHHHHAAMPETRERVEVVEYERVPQYGVAEVICEEKIIETTEEYPRRHHNNGAFLGGSHNYRSFRNY